MNRIRGRVNCTIYTSSHGHLFSKQAAAARDHKGPRKLSRDEIRENVEKADQRFKSSFPGFGYIRTWGGITFLEEYEKDSLEVKPKKSAILIGQVEKFEKDFFNSPYLASFFIFSSNDFKALVSQDVGYF